MGPLFKDRIDAGRQLARQLEAYAGESTVVLGMARGGVILAGEIARGLNAPLDVLVVRKIGAPGNPEYGVGAVAPLDVQVFDDRALNALHVTPDDLMPIVTRELAEIGRRLQAYRGGLPPLSLKGKAAILVDDGLATGITAVAAARYARRLEAERTVFAAPVCSKPGCELVSKEVDEVVCLQIPEMFFAVGMWYEDFTQTEDEQVVRALAQPRIGGYVG